MDLHKIRRQLASMDEAQRARVFKQVRELYLAIRALEYRRYREDDSPKGENVPGVRHK